MPKTMKRKKKNKAELEYDMWKHGITQSLLARFLTCRRKAELYLQRLSSIGVKDTLIFGNLFHKLLEVMHQLNYLGDLRGLKRKARKELLMSATKKVFKNIRKEYAGTATDPQRLEDMLGQAKLMLPYYLNVREGKKRVIDLDFKLRKFLAVEEVFNVDFHGFRLTGKFDGIFRRKGNWLMEIKTKGQITEQELEYALLQDLQIQFYLLAAEEYYDVPFQGVIYNIIRRPRHKSQESFKKALIADPDHFFTRYEVTFPRSSMLQAAENLRAMLDEFADWQNGDLTTYKNFTGCLGKKWNCEYLELCATGRRDLYRTRKVFFEELSDEGLVA